jgi:hypothetical protein
MNRNQNFIVFYATMLHLQNKSVNLCNQKIKPSQLLFFDGESIVVRQCFFIEQETILP